MEELEQLCNQYKDLTSYMLESLMSQMKNKELECQVLEEKVEKLENELEKMKQDKAKQSSDLIDLDKLMGNIINQVSQNDWIKVKSNLKYMIKHYKHYRNFILQEQIISLLHLTYIYGYDKYFVERFIEGNIKWEEKVEQDKVYQMIKKERELPLHEILDKCMGRDVEQVKESVKYLLGLDKEKVLRVLTNRSIKYCKKINLIYDQNKSKISSNPIYKKIKVFVEIQGFDGVVLIEAWQKINTREISVTLEELAYVLKEIEPMYIENVQEEYMNHEFYFDILDEEEQVGCRNSLDQYFEQPLSKAEELERKSNLNEQSPLKSMGYDTSKSREERSHILQKIAVPTLGRERVRGYLEFFIRLNGAKESMALACKEWEYDLKNL